MPGGVLRQEAWLTVLDRINVFHWSQDGMVVAGESVDIQRRGHRAVELLGSEITMLWNYRVLELLSGGAPGKWGNRNTPEWFLGNPCGVALDDSLTLLGPEKLDGLLFEAFGC